MAEKKGIKNEEKINKEVTTSTEYIDETTYLLSTKANRKHLLESIKQMEANETISFSLGDDRKRTK